MALTRAAAQPFDVRRSPSRTAREAARAVRGTHRVPLRHRLPSLLTVMVFATLALAPLEGYLQQVNGSLGKAAPGLFLLTWVADRAWYRRPFGTGHPVVATVSALFVVVVVSAVDHLDPSRISVFYAGRWLPFLILCVALIDVLTHDVHPRVALTALLVGAVCAGLGALYSFAFQGEARATGPLEDPNDLAYVLAAAVPIAVARLSTATGRRFLGYAGAVAFLLAGIAVTVSRGGALAVTAIVIWVVARRVVPPRLLLGAAGALLVVGTVGGLLAAPQIRVALAQKAYIASTNVDTRLLRWQAALRELGDHPLTGVGPGGVQTNYVKYSHFAELAERTPVTHQMYFEVGAELGVFGLTAFLGLILLAATAGELTIRRLQRARTRADDPLLQAAWAAQGSLLAVCVASSFLSEEYYMPLWAALSINAALELRTRPGGVTVRPRRPRRRHRRALLAAPVVLPTSAPLAGAAAPTLPRGLSLGALAQAGSAASAPAVPGPARRVPPPRGEA